MSRLAGRAVWLLGLMLTWCTLTGLSPWGKVYEATEQGNQQLEQAVAQLEQTPPEEVAARLQEALRHYTEGLQADPKSLELLHNIACVLYHSGKFEDASSQFKALSQLEQQNPQLMGQLRYNLGTSLAQQGQLEDAAGQLRKALELSPQDKEAQHNLEVVLARLQQQQQQPTPPPEQQEQDDQEQQDQNQQQQEDQQQEDQQQEDQQDEQQQGQPSPTPTPGEQQSQQGKPSPTPTSGEGDSQGSSSPREQQSQEAQQEQMDRARAESILDAIEDQELEEIRALIPSAPQPAPGGKDW